MVSVVLVGGDEVVDALGARGEVEDVKETDAEVAAVELLSVGVGVAEKLSEVGALMEVRSFNRHTAAIERDGKIASISPLRSIEKAEAKDPVGDDPNGEVSPLPRHADRPSISAALRLIRNRSSRCRSFADRDAPTPTSRRCAVGSAARRS